MTTKIRIIFILPMLIYQPIVNAKCNCSRPSRPGTHNTLPVPTTPAPQQQQPISEYHQSLELPVQNISEYNIPSYVPVGPQLPTVQIPEFQHETQEQLNESSSGTLSKDEARKMALVFGGIVATVAVMGGFLFAKLNRRMDVYEAALRLLGQSLEEKKITEAIQKLNDSVGNLNQRLDRIASQITEKMGVQPQSR